MGEVQQTSSSPPITFEFIASLAGRSINLIVPSSAFGLPNKKIAES